MTRRRRPDLDDDLFVEDDALLVIGDDLVLSWRYVGSGPRSLEFVAREGDGTRLAVMARVAVNDHEVYVAPAVVAELLRGAAAAARRAYPENAVNRESPPPATGSW